MNRRIIWLLLVSLSGLALVGCGFSRVVSSEPMPAVNAPQPGQSEPAVIQPASATPMNGAEKVVTLVPQAEITPAPPTRIPEVSPTPPSFSDFGLTTTRFTDSFSGISFEIPINWNITDLSPEQKQEGTMYSISVRSPMPTPLPKQQEGPLAPGTSAMDVSIWKNEAKSYEEAVALRMKAIRESETPVKVLKTQEFLLGGVKATRMNIESQNGLVVEIVSYTKSGMLLIGAFGDLTLLNTILDTFQIPDPS